MNHDQLGDMGERVSSRAELVAFIGHFSEGVRRGEVRVDNDNLHAYLGALSAWINAADGYYNNCGIDPATVAPWRLFADAVFAATIYE